MPDPTSRKRCSPRCYPFMRSARLACQDLMIQSYRLIDDGGYQEAELFRIRSSFFSSLALKRSCRSSVSG